MARRGPLRRLSVAPMMERTDRHFRFLLRQITRRTLLYTEMITTKAILHGDEERHLGFSAVEKPIALQLGGSDPPELARCARIGEVRGYDEIDLNIGCPSDRVQNATFGACLMKEPKRVADAVAAMKEAVGIPITVKHRIGVDDRDGYEDLHRFVVTVAGAGCDRFIVHARKAILAGLSPRQNRSVPPLRHDLVHRLKRELPQVAIEINGGLSRLDEIEAQLALVDGVMVGRAAHENPFLFAGVDERIFGVGTGRSPPTRREVLEAMIAYARERLEEGDRLPLICRGMAGLAAGRRGARAWRRHLAERVLRPGGGIEGLLAARDLLPDEPDAAGSRG